MGPKVSKGFFNMAEVEAGFPTWQKADRNWANRAARGVGVRGGSKGTRTAYFYGSGFYPFGRSWGAAFAPDRDVPAGARATPGMRSAAPATRGHALSVRRTGPEAADRPTSRPSPDAGPAGPSPGVYSSTIVAPSPPSPRWPARTDVTSAFAPAWRRTASRKAPVPDPWMISTFCIPATLASSR